METLQSLMINGGALLAIVGMAACICIHFIMLFRAFREGLLWGLACLLLPLASFLFILRFWSDMRRLAIGQGVAMLMFVGGIGLALVAPENRAKMKATYEQRYEQLAEFRDRGESSDRNGKRTSSAMRKLQEELEKQEQERLKVMEYRRRATELYAFVQSWHQELQSRQPGAEATDAERERFRKEHTNYSGLLAEYKLAAEQVKKAEAEFLKLGEAKPAEAAPAEPPAPTPSEP